MAFQPPNSRQDVQNRKILEDLLLKKQMLLKQGVMPTLSPSAINAPVMPQPPSMTPEQQQMSVMQRNAQNLAANSNTFYITTDSMCVLENLKAKDKLLFSIYSAVFMFRRSH